MKVALLIYLMEHQGVSYILQTNSYPMFYKIPKGFGQYLLHLRRNGIYIRQKQHQCFLYANKNDFVYPIFLFHPHPTSTGLKLN